VTSLPRLDLTKEATVAHSNRKTRTQQSRRFGQKTPELSPESLNLNGNIFFKLFSTDLDERLASAGYKKDQEKNRTRQQNKPIIFHPMAFGTKTKIQLTSG